MLEPPAAPDEATSEPDEDEDVVGSSMQVPIVLSFDVHTFPAAHPFPPLPRQPGSQVWVALQTVPDVGPPQSESMTQPTQVFDAVSQI